MIDDPELRALFKAESEEHLQILESGLLHLEAEPHDSAVLEELFRSAHNLKGAAGMLGVESVETLAHHFEDQLSATRRGHLVMSSDVADRLYRGLDAMRQLAREASGGEAAQVDFASVLAQLRGELLPETSVPGESMPPEEVARREGGMNRDMPHGDVPHHDIPDRDMPRGDVLNSDIPGTGEEPLEPVSPTTFKIETIRVEPQKLDALRTLAGEMTVTTTRVARALNTIDDLLLLAEDWERDSAALRTITTLSAANVNRSTPNYEKQRAAFHERETERLERLRQLLGSLKRTGQEEVARLGIIARELDESIRAMRLLPFSTLFNLFPRLVRDLSLELGKEVQLVVEGGAVTADKHLLEALKDPLMHIIRNAIDHGIEEPGERLKHGKSRSATLLLRASQTGTMVRIEIADDGQGLDEEAIRRSALQKRLRSAEDIAGLSAQEVQRLIFTPGFSTSELITDLSGRGVGLDVVHTTIERVKGTISVESVRGQGCTFRLQAPMTLATTRVLLVQVAQRSYALPIEAVQEILLLESQDVFSLEGRPSMRHENHPVAVARLADLLELPSGLSEPIRVSARREAAVQARPSLPCILMEVAGERLGLLVDALLDEQEVILKPFGGLLQRVRNVFGATILSSGEICMVLNPQDIIGSAHRLRPVRENTVPNPEAERRRVVLLADDSITTRTQEKRILESAGYEVVTAVDGADAFHKLSSRLFDAVVSDVEMPNMDGLTLAACIRQDPKYREIPIVLVTSLASDADRQRGVEVGANAYITKGTFDQTVLLNTLRRLV